MADQTPLVSFYQLKSFEFTNLRFYTVKGSYGEVVVGIEVSSIDLQSDLNSTISYVSINDSQLKFLRMNSVSNSLVSPKQVLISRLNYTNSHFPFSEDLIESGNMQFEGEFYIVFDRLLFSNITYEFGGNLLLIKNQLSTELLISNSKFVDCHYAGIQIESSGSDSSGLKTMVRIEHSEFDSIDGKHKSAITLSEGGQLEVTNCTFTNISSFERGGVLFAGRSETYAIFKNTLFLNNTALEGATFYIEAQSKVECHN